MLKHELVINQVNSGFKANVVAYTDCTHVNDLGYSNDGYAVIREDNTQDLAINMFYENYKRYYNGSEISVHVDYEDEDTCTLTNEALSKALDSAFNTVNHRVQQDIDHNNVFAVTDACVKYIKSVLDNDDVKEELRLRNRCFIDSVSENDEFSNQIYARVDANNGDLKWLFIGHYYDSVYILSCDTDKIQTLGMYELINKLDNLMIEN